MPNRGNSISQDRLFELPKGPDDSFERSLMEGGHMYVAGVDEAGRGPLAGPVVAAAVVLSIPCSIKGLNDSKKLAPEKRDKLYEIIFREALCVGVGMSQPREIDEINILQASLSAMKQAVESLDPCPTALLIDGISPIDSPLLQKTIKKGDGRCVSIAAASIVAKVTRDRIMTELHLEYPQYGFDRHKGYPTPAHLAALDEHGPCEAHRFTFHRVKELIDPLARLKDRKKDHDGWLFSEDDG